MIQFQIKKTEIKQFGCNTTVGRGKQRKNQSENIFKCSVKSRYVRSTSRSRIVRQKGLDSSDSQEAEIKVLSAWHKIDGRLVIVKKTKAHGHFQDVARKQHGRGLTEYEARRAFASGRTCLSNYWQEITTVVRMTSGRAPILLKGCYQSTQICH